MRIKRIFSTQHVEKEQNTIDISLLDKLIEKYKGKKGNLIPLLQGAQAIYGYLPNEVFEHFSKQRFFDSLVGRLPY